MLKHAASSFGLLEQILLLAVTLGDWPAGAAFSLLKPLVGADRMLLALARLDARLRPSPRPRNAAGALRQRRVSVVRFARRVSCGVRRMLGQSTNAAALSLLRLSRPRPAKPTQASPPPRLAPP